jgi:hypothetical protein
MRLIRIALAPLDLIAIPALSGCMFATKVPLEIIFTDIFDDRDSNCSGQSYSGIIAPGIYNLADYGLNDKISSFKCT